MADEKSLCIKTSADQTKEIKQLLRYQSSDYYGNNLLVTQGLLVSYLQNHENDELENENEIRVGDYADIAQLGLLMAHNDYFQKQLGSYTDYGVWDIDIDYFNKLVEDSDMFFGNQDKINEMITNSCDDYLDLIAFSDVIKCSSELYGNDYKLTVSVTEIL